MEGCGKGDVKGGWDKGHGLSGEIRGTAGASALSQEKAVGLIRGE